MSTSTTLALFALIIAAVCGWQCWLDYCVGKQTAIVKSALSDMLEWMEKQEHARENHEAMVRGRIEALETRPPEFEWEEPK